MLVKLNVLGYWKIFLEDFTSIDISPKGAGKFPDNSADFVGHLWRREVVELFRNCTQVLKAV